MWVLLQPTDLVCFVRDACGHLFCSCFEVEPPSLSCSSEKCPLTVQGQLKCLLLQAVFLLSSGKKSSFLFSTHNTLGLHGSESPWQQLKHFCLSPQWNGKLGQILSSSESNTMLNAEEIFNVWFLNLNSSNHFIGNNHSTDKNCFYWAFSTCHTLW